MGFPLESYGVSVAFLWCFSGMYMIFLLDFYEVTMGLKKISMICLQGFFGNSMGYP